MVKKGEFIASFRAHSARRLIEDEEKNAHSIVQTPSDRYTKLPLAIIREWDTFSPKRKRRLLQSMRKMSQAHKRAVAALREMDEAFQFMSAERDGLNDMASELYEMMDRHAQQIAEDRSAPPKKRRYNQ